ncbi:ROK family protein [Thioclava sp. GXIMD4216]|uniref:ROK family protein n=1 Tax=Thioclava litoralis TaxID=3076557 RepID=A0ABZ1E0P2_9RHOB|nr:ROK family protein [Thioclava sp. FTW29]
MHTATAPRYTLLADIGGTNTRVALAQGSTLVPASVARFPNKGRAALEEILTEYMVAERVSNLAGVCVAVAGPVSVDGQDARMTNLDWTIRASALQATTGAAHVSILNDLQAQGHALSGLAPEALRMVLPGAPAPKGAAQLVVGIGTGFNAAPVHHAPQGYVVVPASECGHITLPLRSELHIEIKRYFERKHRFASVEHACAGRGLERIYAFVTGQEDATVDGKEILSLMQSEDRDALKAAEIFTTLLGGVLGDLALTHLPFGGIYLIGGAARAIEPWLERFNFQQAFKDKGSFSDYMERFSIHVVEDDYAALAGCANYLAAHKLGLL